MLFVVLLCAGCLGAPVDSEPTPPPDATPDATTGTDAGTPTDADDTSDAGTATDSGTDAGHIFASWITQMGPITVFSYTIANP